MLVEVFAGRWIEKNCTAGYFYVFIVFEHFCFLEQKKEPRFEIALLVTKDS